MNTRALLLATLGLGGISLSATPPVVMQTPIEVTPTADGGLRPVAGVQNIQVVRANRKHSPHAGGLTDTYLHAPMLAHWKGRFFLEYLSGPVDEHQPPCSTSLTWSEDGLTWAEPLLAFPSVTLPDGRPTLSHQRMGFHVGASGRLYALSFYGLPEHPNDGTGIGRAIREVREDLSLGPIHFVRLNSAAGWTPDKAPFPMYTTAADATFIADCEDLLGNKKVTSQWWEEERTDEPFHPVKGKAMSWFHRKDGAVVGLWKDAQCSLSRDEGRTWQVKEFMQGIPVNSSKYWGQATSDGRYAIVFNPTSRLRHPLAITLSDDGEHFKGLYSVHGELPDQRYKGGFKNMGPQYVRGIVEGNGSPPDSGLWVTYSVNKEDIWISRIPVPVADRTETALSENFDAMPLARPPEGWNCYSPLWAPVRIQQSPDGMGRVLALTDEEPADYAKVLKLFPASHNIVMTLKVYPRQTTGRLDIELEGEAGERPLQVVLDTDGRIRANHEGQWMDAGCYEAGAWTELRLEVEKGDRAKLLVNGTERLSRALVFAEPCDKLERLVLRTGAHRLRGEGGRDLPGLETRCPRTEFLIDDVSVAELPRDAQTGK